MKKITILKLFPIGAIMKKEYITDAVWSKILKFLKGCKRVYVGNKTSCRVFVEAVCWLCRTGAQWRELPEKYGNWNSVYKRFNNWSGKQIWQKLHQFCIEGPDFESVMIDATIVRAHACAAGYGDQGAEGLGRSRGGFTTKVHVSSAAFGNPLSFIITSGQTHDVTQAKNF